MTASTGPSDRELLIAEWHSSTAKPKATGGRWAPSTGGLLGAHARWASDCFGSTATMAAWGWSTAELRALCSSEQLGATRVRISAST